MILKEKSGKLLEKSDSMSIYLYLDTIKLDYI
jgi:hypothetical protein